MHQTTNLYYNDKLRWGLVVKQDGAIPGKAWLLAGGEMLPNKVWLLAKSKRLSDKA